MSWRKKKLCDKNKEKYHWVFLKNTKLARTNNSNCLHHYQKILMYHWICYLNKLIGSKYNVKNVENLILSFKKNKKIRKTSINCCKKLLKISNYNKKKIKKFRKKKMCCNKNQSWNCFNKDVWIAMKHY